MEYNTVLFAFPEDITSDMTSWCNEVEGFVMTSLKTTVVHSAQFGIVLQRQENVKILTNTLQWAQKHLAKPLWLSFKGEDAVIICDNAAQWIVSLV